MFAAYNMRSLLTGSGFCALLRVIQDSDQPTDLCSLIRISAFPSRYFYIQFSFMQTPDQIVPVLIQPFSDCIYNEAPFNVVLLVF